jgi:hypothetical protein
MVERSGVPEIKAEKLFVGVDPVLESLVAPDGVFGEMEGAGVAGVVWSALEARIVAWAITVERSDALESC